METIEKKKTFTTALSQSTPSAKPSTWESYLLQELKKLQGAMADMKKEMIKKDEQINKLQLEMLAMKTQQYEAREGPMIETLQTEVTSHMLKHTEEEILQHFEEFFEDVHGEFLKHGEIVNFKVCRNESSHLRGNVYVQFQTVECALTAYSAFNGRFYAAKQITCEFVVITRWRAALCGEYMRSHHKVCSHGTACNFLHCFKNPHGLYEWADWDNPPPRSFSKASRLGRGHFEEDKENHKHHGCSDRRHRDDFSSKSRRPHHRDDYQMSRERRYGGCGSNDSSCEESLSVDRDHVQKERQNKSSGKRYKVRHNSKSSTEESVLVERDGLREERKHRSSDKRSREEDGRTRRKEDAKKGRHRSRSNDRHERKRHGDGSRTRGAEDERSVPRRRHRRSRESSQSDGGTSCEQRQDTREKRCDKYERYRPRSRSLTPESSERSPKDVMVSRRRKSSSSSDRRKKRHS